MKKIYTLLFILVASFGLHAHDGFYLTYDDYKTGNLIAVDSNSILTPWNNEHITYTINGKKQTYNASEIFGVIRKGLFCRYFHGELIPLYAYSNICIWHFKWQSDIDWWFISEDIQGKFYHFESYGSLQKLAKEHAKFKPLVDCVTGQLNSITDKRWYRAHSRIIYQLTEKCFTESSGWIKIGNWREWNWKY